MTATISFVVTSWEPEGNATRALVQSIVDQGVDRRAIEVSAERISRPISLNRAIARSTADYIGFCESDVMPSRNAVATLADLLDRRPDVALAAAEVQGFPDDPADALVPRVAAQSPDDLALRDISEQMWTLNFVLYRRSTQVLFDESYFGNQIFDWDFGLELLHHGYRSMVDARCAVAHRQTDYCAKSLSYHACVARNRQIFDHKWRCRADWRGLAAFDLVNPGVIPTIEELTHATEEWQYRYTAELERYGLQEFYFNTRFGDAGRIADFLTRSHPFVRPNGWTSPIVTNIAQSAPRESESRPRNLDARVPRR